MSRLVPVILLVIHAIGVALTVATAFEVWLQRALVEELLGEVLAPVLGEVEVSGASVLLLVLVVAIAVAGSWDMVRTFQRWLRSGTEVNGSLRVRVAVYGAAACVVFSLFVLSAPETFTGPYRVVHPIVAEIVAALGYGGFLFANQRLKRRRQLKVSARARRLDVLAMNAVASLVLLELTLRVVSSFVGVPILINEDSDSQIRRDAGRLLHGDRRFDTLINEGGHFDSPFLPRSELSGPLVASIGGSFSYGVVPHAFHFTTAAERSLPGVQVYNMGSAGIDPYDYRHLLKTEAIPLDPDLVIVHLFVGRDIVATRPYRAPPRWHDADISLVAMLARRLVVLSRAEIQNWIDSEDALDAVSPNGGAPGEQYPWLADPLREPPSLGAEVFLELERRNADRIGVDDPALYEGFEDALDALDAAAADFPLAFVLIPDVFQVEDGLWRAVQEGSPIPMERDRPQRQVTAWMTEHDIPVLDLLPALRSVPALPDGSRHLYHRQDPHFNARGNAIAGEALAGFIAPLLVSGTPRARALSLPWTLEIGNNRQARALESGWNDPEGNILWSDGPASVLVGRFGKASDITLNLDCLPFDLRDGTEQTITIRLNGTPVHDLALDPGRNRYSVTLPREHLKGGRNVIRFEYGYVGRPTDVIPGSTDPRELAVAWFGIGLEEAASAATGRGD